MAGSGFDIGDTVDAGTQKLSGDRIWDLVVEAGTVIVASGSKVLRYVPAADTKDELLAKITGRTGNLRAPALKIGGELLVGYNEAIYERFR